MCASFTDQPNASMEWQEKPKIIGGTYVNMIILQFARNSKSLKKQKRDVRKKNVSKCIIIFANGTNIARIKKIANFINQKESKQSLKSNNQPSFQPRDGSRPERRYECNNYDSSEKKTFFRTTLPTPGDKSGMGESRSTIQANVSRPRKYTGTKNEGTNTKRILCFTKANIELKQRDDLISSLLSNIWLEIQGKRSQNINMFHL